MKYRNRTINRPIRKELMDAVTIGCVSVCECVYVCVCVCVCVINGWLVPSASGKRHGAVTRENSATEVRGQSIKVSATGSGEIERLISLASINFIVKTTTKKIIIKNKHQSWLTWWRFHDRIKLIALRFSSSINVTN